jgi:membrane-associated protease RseP (regulator of RpoE activity)
VSIAVVMIVHEFSHGIFMRLSKTKIKSTGIVFLGPILGAFVEQDDVSFQKKKRFDQMTILAAGVFANFVFAILFYLLYIGFFALSFNATGAVFSDYAIGIVNVSQIDGQFDGKGYTVLIVGNNNYFLNEAMELQLANNSGLIYAYYDSPAFRAQMKGVITQINDVQIRSANDIRLFMQEKSPGDIITITTTLGEYEIELEEHPYDLEVPFIGISYSGVEPVGIWENFLVSFSGFMPETINYETTWDGDLVYFIYHMLWWIMIINFLVALFNMLPLGILDGGRFFYLTVEKFTNEKVAAKAFRLMTQFIIFLFAAMMFLWAIRLF